jgi:hypothetical protein
VVQSDSATEPYGDRPAEGLGRRLVAQAVAEAVACAARRDEGVDAVRAAEAVRRDPRRLGVDVKVILTSPCIFCIENQ